MSLHYVTYQSGSIFLSFLAIQIRQSQKIEFFRDDGGSKLTITACELPQTDIRPILRIFSYSLH